MNTCTQCATAFEIAPDDLVFYNQIEVVPPKLCPDCRQQRRTAWRNERTLYSNTCARCQQAIVSIYAPDGPLTVYCSACWWSDDWSALEYGQDIDWSRPFFEQWNELNIRTPKLALINDNNSRSVNCEYTNDFAYGKDCYMVFNSWHQQGCLYSNLACRTNFSADVSFCSDSELLYECVDCENCYGSRYLISSSSSSNCHFSYDLKNCTDCFLSSGIRGKQYYIRNQPHTKEQYEQFLANLDLGSWELMQQFKDEFLTTVLPRAPRRNLNLKNCEASIGDYLVNCKNIFMGFDYQNGQDGKFLFIGEATKNCYDLSNCGNSELCYESITPDESYFSRFTIFSWKNRFATYTNDCHSCHDIFGCVSLRQAKYCILNKQYSKEEYETLVPRLIEHMKATGEWGEFFPIQYSPFAYNETMAAAYYPLNQAEVEKRGWRWRSVNPARSSVADTIKADSLPDSIADVDESKTWQIASAQSGALFRITPQEMAFYKQQNIPLPRLHPNERHAARMALRNPRTIVSRHCDSCGQSMQSTYTVDRPEKVFCEPCYLKTLS